MAARATVLAGTRVGRHAVVGAGAVLHQDLPELTLHTRTAPAAPSRAPVSAVPPRTPLRVLHAVTLHSPTGAFGGPVRVALNLAHGLRERGHEPRLLALADGFGPTRPPTWRASRPGCTRRSGCCRSASAASPPPPCWPRRAALCGAPTWSTCTSHATW